MPCVHCITETQVSLEFWARLRVCHDLTLASSQMAFICILRLSKSPTALILMALSWSRMLCILLVSRMGPIRGQTENTHATLSSKVLNCSSRTLTRLLGGTY